MHMTPLPNHADVTMLYMYLRDRTFDARRVRQVVRVGMKRVMRNTRNERAHVWVRVTTALQSRDSSKSEAEARSWCWDRVMLQPAQARFASHMRPGRYAGMQPPRSPARSLEAALKHSEPP